MGGERFDGGVLLLVLVAALVVLGACVFGADWVRPPRDGPGPFVTEGRAHAFRLTAMIAGAICLVGVVRAGWDRSWEPLVAAVIAVVVVVAFAFVAYFPQGRVELRTDGFGTALVQTTTGSTVRFHNGTGEGLVLCLGIAGDCDGDAAGPARLRSPGLVIAAGHRAGVKMPNRTGDYRVTIAGSGPGRRDLILHVERPQGP